MSIWPKELIEKIVRAVADWVDRCLPKYEPGVWNDGDGVQFNNNCYNYGCDIQTNTYAQPGEASGIILDWPDDMNCAAVTAGAVADGLAVINCDEGCGCDECRHQVALVMDPEFDYHWCRKDQNGNWSHKIGGQPATNLDNSGYIITDPRTADWSTPWGSNYNVFCGCFCVNKTTVTVT